MIWNFNTKGISCLWCPKIWRKFDIDVVCQLGDSKIIREYVGIKASLWSIGGLSVARRVRACGQKISKYQINWKSKIYVKETIYKFWFELFNTIIRIGNNLVTKFCGWVKFETWYWTSLARASPFTIWHLLKEKGQRPHIASENGPAQKNDT